MMEFESAQYTDPSGAAIAAVVGGVAMSLPAVAGNRHYDALLASGIPIAPYEPPEPAASDVTAEAWRRKCLLLGVTEIGQAQDAIAAGTREALALRVERDKRPWTPQEEARAAQLNLFQAAIASIDAMADALAGQDPIPADYADDSRWPLPPQAVQEVPRLQVLIEQSGIQPRAPSVASMTQLEAVRTLAAADVRLAAAAKLALEQGADLARYAATDIAMELAYAAKTGNSFATEQIQKLASVSGRTVLDEADAIIAERDDFRARVMDIEAHRAAGLLAIAQAGDEAAIATEREAAIDAIYYLAWA